MASGSTFYLPPRLRVLDLLLPTRQWAVSSFCSLLPSLPSSSVLRKLPALINLDVQETQNTAQAEEESREIAQITNKIHLDQITHLELPSIARLLCVAARYFLFLRAR